MKNMFSKAIRWLSVKFGSIILFLALVLIVTCVPLSFTIFAYNGCVFCSKKYEALDPQNSIISIEEIRSGRYRVYYEDAFAGGKIEVEGWKNMPFEMQVDNSIPEYEFDGKTLRVSQEILARRLQPVRDGRYEITSVSGDILSSSDNLTDRLGQIEVAHRQDLISDEEYTELRKQVLD